MASNSWAVKHGQRILRDHRNVVHVAGFEYRVKSESQSGVYYDVHLDPRSCECANFRKRGDVCKHIAAARLSHAQRALPEPSSEPLSRKSYPNKPWYDEACKHEFRAVRELARCLGLQYRYNPSGMRGRPGVCYGDLLVCELLARYNHKSSRFAIEDPLALVEGGYLQRPCPPEASTLRTHRRSDAMLGLMRETFRRTTESIRATAKDFVIDGVFIGTPNSEIEVAQSMGQVTARMRMRNAKFTIAADVDTLIAVGLLVTEEHVSDQKCFIPTLKQFWDDFSHFDNVYADSGYLSSQHYEAVAARGGTAWIDFKERLGKSYGPKPNAPHYNAQLAAYNADRTKFLDEYHRRNLIESLNSAFLRRVAKEVRARYETTLMVEAFAMLTIYNLIKLHQACWANPSLVIPWADDRAMNAVHGRQ